MGTVTNLTTYETSICFDGSDTGYEVVTDRLAEEFSIVELSPPSDSEESDAHVWDSAFPDAIGIGTRNVHTGPGILATERRSIVERTT